MIAFRSSSVVVVESGGEESVYCMRRIGTGSSPIEYAKYACQLLDQLRLATIYGSAKEA